MKRFDFTQPGGFPLTQDRLSYMQDAYTEIIKGLAYIGGDGTVPFVISGCIITRTFVSGTTYDYSITDGWICYNGKIIRTGPVTLAGVDESINSVYLEVISSGSSLTYNNGSTPTVVFDEAIALNAYPVGTPDDASKFLYSHLRPLGIGFGLTNREQVWQHIVVNTPAASGGVTGDIYYKKDFTANTLQIRAFLTANNAQNFAASPGALFYSMGTLPAGYIPLNNTYFTGHYFISTMIKDDLGISWIKQFTCGVNSGGQVLVNWIRPDISIGGYGLQFNTIIPLD